MSGLLPVYFRSEWSYAQLRTSGARTLCAFNDDATALIAVTTDGQYYMAEIPKGGGDCVIIEKLSLLNRV